MHIIEILSEAILDKLMGYLTSNAISNPRKFNPTDDDPDVRGFLWYDAEREQYIKWGYEYQESFYRKFVWADSPTVRTRIDSGMIDIFIEFLEEEECSTTGILVPFRFIGELPDIELEINHLFSVSFKTISLEVLNGEEIYV